MSSWPHLKETVVPSFPWGQWCHANFLTLRAISCFYSRSDAGSHPLHLPHSPFLWASVKASSWAYSFWFLTLLNLLSPEFIYLKCKSYYLIGNAFSTLMKADCCDRWGAPSLLRGWRVEKVSHQENKSRREGRRGMGKLGKGEGEVQLPVMEQISHRDKKPSTRNGISDTAIGLCGDSW